MNRHRAINGKAIGTMEAPFADSNLNISMPRIISTLIINKTKDPGNGK